MKQLISIVAPVFNEQDNIFEFHKRLTATITPLFSRYDFEIILVDDGSKDRSWDSIRHLCFEPGYVGIKLSRNFGHQVALSAGYDAARGAAVISIDSDLQDPPELIPQLLAQWEQGAYVVYARRIGRIDSWLKKFTADLYYRLLEKTARVNIPRNVGDYRLIDQQILRVLQQSKEHARYLRGMVAWCGFPQTFVDFQRSARVRGMTGYTWNKMFRLACDGFIGFSNNFVWFPLMCAVTIGTSTLILAGCTIFSIATRWAPVIITSSLTLTCVCLWAISEYVSRMYEMSRGQPLYLIEQVCSQKATHVTQGRYVEPSSRI
jgi:polyisoprenyl-phosphate glycosyltransferase